ncbi:hypothetical protein [Paracoccus sp. MKU1]|uniref:hypothetical protein n=1 Tax=Paracoccus sp. MKU1 TaxID=1745182 RepID=UPI0007192845|nr:hypothetical protein [Paracoccus sp. MKU1]KRW98047.1 hypothetical protein AQY21_00300 [Paracoccus sp. MKU1]
MHHEVMRHPAPNSGSDNVSDVLASIRRLIAQDEAGCRIPNQVLNRLPDQDGTPDARIEPEPVSPARITPLVLDSSTLVARDPVPSAKADWPRQDATQPMPEPVAAATEPRQFGDWLRVPPQEAAGESHPKRPEVAADLSDDAAPVQPDAAAPTAPSMVWPEPAQIRPFGPSLEAPTTTILQMEETMLHANASVTPINPLAEAHAAAEALSRETEPHLFAPQDKDAQKGTHLRGMIREAIRQELQGEIGNRLSRNLQQMIRHEIELALRQMCEQD